MIRWPAIALCFTALLARPAAVADEWTAAGIAEFRAAFQAWDEVRFQAAAGLFRRASTNAPQSPVPHYWLGVAEFHRLLHARSQSPSRDQSRTAAAALEAALAALQQAVKLDPRQAESHALLGTLYGLKIDGSALRAMRLGPRVQHHRSLAMAQGADNPRVRYLLGTCQFHLARKPATWREALATLLAAEQLFAAEAQRPAGPFEPRWGRSSCLTFIGQTYERLGQRTEAASYFRKALALHPADHLAQAGLARVVGQP
jgi:tetratricopeptide (TPR) repeat protein